MNKIAAKQALTENGWESEVVVTIDSRGRIAEIAQGTAAGATRVDLLLPAPTNVHSHAFQRAMAGWSEARGPDPSDSFWTWRRLMYRFLDRLNPDQTEAIAALVFMEMLEAGYAGVAEFHYLHHQVGGVPYEDRAELSSRIVSAAQGAGIGLTLLPVLYQFGGCNGRPLQGGQLRFGNTPDQYAELFEAAARSVEHGSAEFKIGVAPHSLRAVDMQGLQAVLELCPDGPVHMHLAEQVAEVAEVEAHLGARPTEWLLQHLPVDERWCLIHCTQMTDDEAQSLARSKAVAGLCPLTESNLGDGIFSGEVFLNNGGRIAVGSDSNIHISLFEELKTLEYSQRLKTRRRAVLATEDASTGRRLFDAVCNGGVQAAGRDAGILRSGAYADMIGLSTDNQWLNNGKGDMVLDGLIFAGHGQQCISDVWSAGRHVVKEGRHRDRDRIVSGFRSVMEELRTSA